MPTYEYECSVCKHNFEQFQSIAEPPLKKCPECGGRVKRMIGIGAGVIFKGSGFYETDYKKKAEPQKCPAAKDEKTPSPCSESVKEKCAASSEKKESTSCCQNSKSSE